MKKIFFLIAVFFSFAGYAQTVGQLRYDTVKMYKVGGTTELIIQNATKDRTNAAFKNMGNGRGAWENVVDSVFKNATADSFVYYIGGVRRAFKDSIGTGSFARDTIVAGRGLTGTPLSATKVQLDNDSGYYAGIIRDDTLVLYRYNGDSTEFTLPSGGSGWGLTGEAGTVYGTNFIGTTDNVSLGFRVNNVNAGQLNVTTQSTGFGVEALNSNTGARNNAFGWNAGFSNTTGTDNNSHGHASLYKTTTGINNNAFGYSSLYENITGSKNNAFGYRALAQSVSGTMNTAMGDSSLITLTTGSRNTAIGANADVATSSTDSAIAIGYEAVASTKQLAFSPHVTEIKATGITGASNSGYVLTTNGSGIATFQAAGSSVLTGNVAYVDAVNGDDGTGTLGDFTKPFLTLGAAVTAAPPGYTIVVRPGSYSNATQLLKDSVDWYFMPNTKVSQTNATGTAMFDDSGGFDAVCKITGYGVFIDTLGGEACILKVEDAASNIYFEAQSISVGNGNANVGITMANGNVIANIKGTLGSGTISSSTYDAIIVTGGTLNLTADKIISTGPTEGNAIEVTGGTVNIKCMEYRTTGAYDAFGSTSAIAYSGGNATIEGEGVSELADGLVTYGTSTGVLTLRGKLTTSVKTPIVYLSDATNKKVINQATLVSADTYSISAATAQTLVSYGSFANKVTDANITINGILTVGSYVQ